MRGLAQCIGLAAAVAAFVPFHASATPFQTCGLHDNGCCTICVLHDCDTGAGHPDLHCNLGRALSRVEVEQSICSSEGIPDGNAYCNGIAAGIGPLGVCQPYDFSAEAEVADGVDNNCDGITMPDERCDGIDDDGDLRFDEGQGSCLERHLFVPVCWQSNDQTEFNSVVERYERFLQDKTLLNYCGIDSAGTAKKIWYEAAPIGTLACPAGAAMNTDLLFDTLLTELKMSRDLRDWDSIAFVTSLPSAMCIAGRTPGGGAMMLRSEGYNTPFPGEYVVFAHEWGHNVTGTTGNQFGLGEEYEIDDPGTPNPLLAALGCDPSNCCVNSNACSTGLCFGNESKDISSWDWGQPDPPTFGDGSRCIMANASAPGWNTGDPITAVGSHRGWCQACLNHIDQHGPDCDQVYGGTTRRLQVSGWVDASGKVHVIDYDVGIGRLGYGVPMGGETQIELRSGTTVLAVFAPKAVSAEPTFPATEVGFLARLPVAPSVTGPITVTSLQNGTPISQVTGGGSPAVPVAPDITEECESADATEVTLDASASYDPDGDTLYFAWDRVISLSDPTAPTPTGEFPLGTTTVELSVLDGSDAGGTIAVDVTVEDTQGPVLQATAVQASTCGYGPTQVTLTAPSVSDCFASASITLEAELISVHGHALAVPTPIDPITKTVKLPLGSAQVRWTGTDPEGNDATVVQNVQVSLAETAAVCCAGKTPIEGNGLPNWLTYFDGQPYCIFGRGGGDTIHTGAGADFLAGGASHDLIKSSGAGNVLVGGDGDDWLELPGGSGTIYGGPGDDVVEDTWGGVIYGNAGNDMIETDFVAHEIIPGPGRDAVHGGTGNDTVIIYDSCELQPFEVLKGGLGSDTLVTPVSLFQLFAMGVSVSGFETVVVSTANSHLSECF